MDKICLVIPCYNEAERLDVNAFQTFLNTHKDSALCFVDDGSGDNTFRVLESIKSQFPNQVSVIKLLKNAGKAQAVRTGILQSLNNDKSITHIGYFDADLSAPLEESYYLKSYFTQNPALELAFGSRVAKIGSNIERKTYRHLAGRAVATAISFVLGLMIYDTQCGAKLFSRELAQKVFKDAFVSRWLFDVEIFSRIIHLYGREKAIKSIVEVPLNEWVHRDGSKISAAYSFKIFWDLYKIKRAAAQYK